MDWHSRETIGAILASLQYAKQHIVVIDLDGRIQYSNTDKEFAGDSVGTTIFDHLPAESHEIGHATLARLRSSSEIQRFEVPAFNSSQEQTWFDCSVVPLIISGTVAGASVFATDVGPQRRAEAVLRDERQLLRQHMEIQERERRLLAYEIHDGLIQDIVGAQMLLESMGGQLDAPPATVTRTLQTLRQTLGKAIDEGRRLMDELRPMMMDEEGLVSALQYLIKQEEAFGAFQLSLECDAQMADVSPMLAGTAYRIVQESLANARRHSQATEVTVRLRQGDSVLTIEIVDNGKGFDLENCRRGMGLNSIYERARLFDGTADITSQIGSGTRIHVELPFIAPA